MSIGLADGFRSQPFNLGRSDRIPHRANRGNANSGPVVRRDKVKVRANRKAKVRAKASSKLAAVGQVAIVHRREIADLARRVAVDVAISGATIVRRRRR